MSQDTLSLILRRIDAPIEPVFSYDEVRLWPEGDLELLVKLGLLRETAPAKSVECDGCEEACIEEVVYIDGPKEGRTRAYVACHSRDDIGRIDVPLEHLKRWIVDLPALAGQVANLLRAEGTKEETVPDRLWWLGHTRLSDKRIEVFLTRGAGWPDSKEAFGKAPRLREASFSLVLVPANIPPQPSTTLDGKVVSLLRLLSVRDNQLRLDMEELVRVVGKARAEGAKVVVPFPTPEGITWEQVAIEFVREDMVKITAGSVVEHRGYEETGFANRGKMGTPPNTQWELMKILAKGNGRIDWGDGNVIPRERMEKLKKQISNLRKALKGIFDIDGDPFLPYQQVRGYETRFILLYSVTEEDFR